MSNTPILSPIAATLGPEMLEKIQSSNILVVGAGGIGTELLKNLAMCGFRKLDVYDLDTVDASNLNRQLLFRLAHVGQPKCVVACAVAQAMAEDPSVVKYTPHHGNVCDNTHFNVGFVQNFDLVLNALDNVTARRRVNRICLAAGVPLIEAGTTGYLGQVNVIDKASEVACYECKTQETQKVYPICTIRSTPSMPVHTIVWAKECYKLLFHSKTEESMLYEDPNGEEPSTYMKAVEDFRAAYAKRDKPGIAMATRAVVEALYHDEIQKQLDMDRYKTAAKKPEALSKEVIGNGLMRPLPPSSAATYRTTDVWSVEDCLAEFAGCLATADPETALESFDKDDDLAMRFVTAASNLRSHVFGITPIQSLYAAKGIAGNIIPAIATTNAIAAGVQILQCFHILRKQIETGSKAGGLADCCSYVNCIRNPTRNGLYLTSAQLEPPNPRCFVCRSAMIPLTLTVANWTLADLLEKVFKADLGFQEPTVMIEDECIWEEGQDADLESFAVNLHKKLSDLPCGGIQHGTSLLVEDFSQDLTVQIMVSNKDDFEPDPEAPEEDLSFKFVVGGQPNKPVKSTENGDVAKKPEAPVENGTADDDEIVEVVDPNANKKRASVETNGNGPSKRQKTNNEENLHNTSDDAIEIE